MCSETRLSQVLHTGFPAPSSHYILFFLKEKTVLGKAWVAGTEQMEQSEKGQPSTFFARSSQPAVDLSTLLISGCSSASRQYLVIKFLE